MNSEIIDAPDKAGTEIVEYTQTAAELAKLRQRYANVVWDCTTTKGDKDARSVRMELVKLRTSLDKMRLQLNADDQARIARRNTEAKRIAGEIAELEEPVDAAIKSEEARREAEKQAKIEQEQRRVAALQRQIDVIRNAVVANSGILVSAHAIAGSLVVLQALEIGPSFQEFEEQARDAKADTLAKLRELHTAAVEREAEAARIVAELAELERLRAERAERERAERARVAAEQRAEADRLAVERRQLEAEQAASRAVQARLDAEATALRQRADQEAAAQRAEADRVARVAREAEQHRLDVERAALLREQQEVIAVAKREEEERRAAEIQMRDASRQMLDALLQWRTAEETKDDEELQNARVSRDIAIAAARG